MTSVATPSAPATSPRSTGAPRHRRSGKGTIGAALILLMAAISLAAPWISAHDPTAQNVAQRLRPPLWEARSDRENPLGTDGLGRDLLSRIAHGGRLSLSVAALSVLLAAAIGVPLGVAGGYFGKLPDQIVSALVDMQLSLPFLLMALVFVAVFGASITNLVLVLGLAGWASYCRMMRAQVLALRERDFVLGAVALGATDARIIRRHILPNVVPPLIVVSVLNLARFMLAEATLNFLGLGAPPPTPTWGSIIGEGRAYLFTAPWIQILPGVAMLLTISGIALFGDWLRDRMDRRVAA